jgi:hypothetical protein
MWVYFQSWHTYKTEPAESWRMDKTVCMCILLSQPPYHFQHLLKMSDTGYF